MQYIHGILITQKETQAHCKSIPVQQVPKVKSLLSHLGRKCTNILKQRKTPSRYLTCTCMSFTNPSCTETSGNFTEVTFKRGAAGRGWWLPWQQGQYAWGGRPQGQHMLPINYHG